MMYADLIWCAALEYIREVQERVPSTRRCWTFRPDLVATGYFWPGSTMYHAARSMHEGIPWVD